MEYDGIEIQLISKLYKTNEEQNFFYLKICKTETTYFSEGDKANRSAALAMFDYSTSFVWRINWFITSLSTGTARNARKIGADTKEVKVVKKANITMAF